MSADPQHTTKVVDLFQRRYAAVVRALRPSLGPDAEDAAQECMLRLLRHRGPVIDNPEAYLSTMANHLRDDWLAHHRVVRAHAERTAVNVQEKRIDIEDERSAEETCANKQELALLHGAMQELHKSRPEVCQAFEMIRHDELSVAETARRMGVSRRRVTKYLCEAQEHLAKARLNQGPHMAEGETQ